MINTQKPLTEHQLQEANRRLNILHQVEAMVGSGITQRQAAEQLGVPLPTLCRWKEAYGPERNFNALVPKASSGRPSAAKKLAAKLGEEKFQNVIETVKGYHASMETKSGAWDWALHDPQNKSIAEEDKAIVKQALDLENKESRHNKPRSLMDAIEISPAERLKFQGNRQFRLQGLCIPRYMDILPGDVFVVDDTTPIWGWWVPWPKGRFGKKVLQGQLISLVDFASLKRIAFALIARERGSYRAVDIWSFYGDVGIIPRLGYLHEGGTFQAMLLRGQKIEVQEGEATYERRVGALNGLPTMLLPFHREKAGNNPLPATLQIYRSYEPKTKPVELGFRLEQSLEGCLYGALGRDQRRKPFEKAKRIFEACQRDTEDPEKHFLSAVTLQERLAQMYQYLDSVKMEGRIYQGKPQENWDNSIKEHGIYSLPAELSWLFRRNWKVITPKAEVVEVSYKDEESGERVYLHYSNPEIFARFNGKQLVLYYDRQNPQKPAELVHDNKYLGQAEFFNPTGCFLDKNERGYELRKEYNNCVSSLTRVLFERAPSRQLPPEIAQYRAEQQTQQRAASASPFQPSAIPLPDGARVQRPPTREELRNYGMTPEEIAESEKPRGEAYRPLTKEELNNL